MARLQNFILETLGSTHAFSILIQWEEIQFAPSTVATCAAVETAILFHFSPFLNSFPAMTSPPLRDLSDAATRTGSNTIKYTTKLMSVFNCELCLNMYIFVSLILKCVSLLLVCFWLLCKCNVWVDDCGSGAAEPKMIQIPILPDKRNGYVWVDESERERDQLP